MQKNMMKLLGCLVVIVILMSIVPTVVGAPVTYDKNTILCDHDFAFANSLSEAEIQVIFDARNSFFKDYIDSATSQRASWVIADRAQHYQISSRVLLAKMQAESSSVWAYRDMNEYMDKDDIDKGTRVEWVLFYGWSDTTIYPQRILINSFLKNPLRLIAHIFDFWYLFLFFTPLNSSFSHFSHFSHFLSIATAILYGSLLFERT